MVEITKEWLEKHAALEGDSEIGAGIPTYIPPFIPSEADRYYNAVIAHYQASHASLLLRIKEVEDALKRMEWACEQLAATRTLAVYDAMISGGQTQALLELVNARRQARSTLEGSSNG